MTSYLISRPRNQPLGAYQATGAETEAEQQLRWAKLAEAASAKAKEQATADKSTFQKFWEGFTKISAPGTPTATPVSSAQPSWVMPAVIGGGALLLILALRKR